MQKIILPEELQKQCLAWRKAGKSIALVPTMGFFHAGHESLMEKARTLADKLVVTLFVNPTQFAPNEDLASYPRNLEKDLQIADAHKVDLIFLPEPASMYHQNHATWVDVPDLATTLCALSRPAHFRGVATVVSKLFLLTQPTVAVFGEKDWQQLAIIKRMVRDLHFPIEILGAPIHREADGLAMSSRNAYLSQEERLMASHLQKGLQLAREKFKAGEKNCAVLQKITTEYWAKFLPLGQVDYCSFVHPEDIVQVKEINEPTIMAAAVRLGKARLIDNILIG